jgi:hypothetical protein
MVKAKQSDWDEINTTPPEIFKRQTYNTNEMKMTDTTNTTNMNNTIQTNQNVRWTERKPNNTVTWSENKRWLVAVIGLFCVIGIICGLIIYDLLLHVMVGVLGVWLLSMLLVVVKDLIDNLIDGK